MPNALVIDDDPDTREMLAELVRHEGFDVTLAESLKAGRAALDRIKPAVLITDLMLPDGEGTALLGELPARDATRAIVITGHASLDSAIDALRLGAVDYLQKPIDAVRLKAVLDRVPRTPSRSFTRFGRLHGGSSSMHELFALLSRIARTVGPVLISGERGSGKRTCAETLHEVGPRGRQAFIAVDCVNLSPERTVGELFGRNPGSGEPRHRGFLERAQGGTLVLDEVTALPMEMQAAILRVLESGVFTPAGTAVPVPFDVRLVATTSRVPARAVAEGRLNAELHHRLELVPIRMPPLRERGGDLDLLARVFLDGLNATEGRAKTFAPGALAPLHGYDWPGNVRELENLVRRAYLLSGDVIQEGDLEQGLASGEQGETISVRVGTTLEDVERRLTLATLAACGNVKRRAAEILGISLKTLYNRLDYYAAKGLIERTHAALPVRPRPTAVRSEPRIVA